MKIKMIIKLMRKRKKRKNFDNNEEEEEEYGEEELNENEQKICEDSSSKEVKRIDSKQLNDIILYKLVVVYIKSI